MENKTVTMKGNPLALSGNRVSVGDTAPDFEVTGNDLASVKLSDFQGKTVVLSAVPSLDTPVCDMQTRRFNTEAANLGDDVVILTISMDLPFAQKRWCGAAGVDKVITLSDHKSASFGQAYGVLIDALRLLARAVFVVGPQGQLTYAQIVPEVTEEPNYDNVLEAIAAVAK